jgi:hypothetical protein
LAEHGVKTTQAMLREAAGKHGLHLWLLCYGLEPGLLTRSRIAGGSWTDRPDCAGNLV